MPKSGLLPDSANGPGNRLRFPGSSTALADSCGLSLDAVPADSPSLGAGGEPEWDIIEMAIRGTCSRKPELTDRFRKSLHLDILELVAREIATTRCH